VNNRLLERFKESIKSTFFNALKISLSSPDQIRSLSYGEVKKIETINYRTLKPEKDGLFCPRIFGPVQDWSCICGKYKRMKHRGVVCEKCGVEVIESRVRRERMGHIELVAPVAHIWYLRGTPSYLSLILDMTVKDIERIVYFEAYIVVNQGKSPYPIKTILTANERANYIEKNPEDLGFNADIGAEAIKAILEKMDLEFEVIFLQAEYAKATSLLVKTRIMKRIKILSHLNSAKLRPEWMFLKALPVLPPDLRPLIPLDGDRFASSDLNELYRRVINRNIRLKRLMDIHAPSVIIKNEKRMLQESVDALIDNGRRSQPVRMNKRPLKSLSEMLRGKHGRFRQNLLGKRVDYSARSVIVVDPELKIDQCGIPKLMALELFKSHVLCELIKRGIAPNIRSARKIIENMEPAAWDVLEDIVHKYPILLNRAPTLHRLGIQAFYPTLVDSKAIKIHPMVTPAYNADFDGDQMGVYIPLSRNAIMECKKLIMSSENLLAPQNGKPVMFPHQEMVLGLYYMTKMRQGLPGEGMVFSSIKELITAYECGVVHLHTIINVRLNDGKIVKTNVGRSLLYNALPEGSNFDWVNKILNKSDMTKLVEMVYYEFGNEKTVITLDKIKNLGFHYATMSGVTFSYDHLIDPEHRESIIAQAEKDVAIVDKLYQSGTIMQKERFNKILQIWDNATSNVASDMIKSLQEWDKQAFENKDKKNKEFNFLFMALDSRSRGSTDQIKQLIGMRGLMAKPSGEIMETPVKSNFKNGLTVFEYFTSTHGARKGQADTALKTANAGYLTRRLVDVAQDLIVVMLDCFTEEYLEFEDLIENGEIVIPLYQRVFGRIAAKDVYDKVTNELLVAKGELITRAHSLKIQNAPVSKISARSVVKCQSKRGVCAKCYGIDLSRDALVNVGCPVGIIAAQSIGEPGTQLTMRTFHIGGTANLADKSAFYAKHNGKIKFYDLKSVINRNGHEIVINRKTQLVVVTEDGKEIQKHNLEYGSILNVKSDQSVNKGDLLFDWDSINNVIISEYDGKVEYNDLIPNVTVQNRYDETTGKITTFVLDQKADKYQPGVLVGSSSKDSVMYYLPHGALITVDNGSDIKKGDVIAKIPRETSKNKDITGGLPKIAELFEARMVKDPCQIAEFNGEIEIGSVNRGMRKVILKSPKRTLEYLIPKSKQLNVANGDFVVSGESLTSGQPILHDVLRIMGIDYLQYYLINQIQLVYRAQGVPINDRHFELIIKQMTRKVRIVDPGDTNLLVDDKVDKVHVDSINKSLLAEGKKEVKYIPELMGITLASLGTESMIAAASFQETTRILSEAAISGQVDYLYGPKENVIIGRLIPAGTGLEQFKKTVFLGGQQG
jgi:DNA-directed RNA polymerase subunit beta'